MVTFSGPGPFAAQPAQAAVVNTTTNALRMSMINPAISDQPSVSFHQSEICNLKSEI
jgi:hypothetical protein